MRPPRLSLESFPRASLDLPDTPPNEYWASASIAALPGAPGLVSSFCSSSPSFGIGSLQTPPRSGRPGLASRFRSSRSAENSHLRDSKHAWQTKTTRRLSSTGCFMVPAITYFRTLRHYHRPEKLNDRV